MDSFLEAKNLIGKSQNISIFLSKLSEKSLGAVLSLFYTLKKIGKNVNFYLEEPEKKFQFLNNQIFNNCTISINTSEKEIAEIGYEKNKDSLKFHLFFKEGGVEEKDISLGRSKNSIKKLFQPDLLITLGIQKKENLADFSKEPGFFNRIPVLNIDNQISNENFGRVNLIDYNFSLSEFVAKIIKKLGGQYTLSQIKLFNLFFDKLEYSREKDLHIILLSKEIFKETEARLKDLALLIKILMSAASLPNFLVLVENPSQNSVLGIFYSKKQDLNKKILANFQGKSKGNGSLFWLKESNLNQSKEEILKLL
ncbi:MAG: hypothetical protein COS47_00055 [Candidatus Nealsonbacteria bacterium CG03_land_8_20_14_0_80_36_12]|uniref:Uncharacterized protein n=1 Tax=Candidatus Nealsonbacteria bacterium CG03_land_8_20_14_0_80_36_12 TaxID=1974701 RepID=A0A2M7BZ15_9BACT|nr:MAG: hypothetical protein COS47_00055 [Candidatus Nealsonbacteria bacterium CG03_land_8_20_14_0_80_36_12]